MKNPTAGARNAERGSKAISSSQKITALVPRDINEPVSAFECTKPRRTNIWAMEKHSAVWKAKYSAISLFDNKKAASLRPLVWRIDPAAWNLGLAAVRGIAHYRSCRPGIRLAEASVNAG
jgi:hypothetical protein